MQNRITVALNTHCTLQSMALHVLCVPFFTSASTACRIESNRIECGSHLNAQSILQFCFVFCFFPKRCRRDRFNREYAWCWCSFFFSLSFLHFIESYINNNKHMERIEIVEIEWNSIEKS